MNAYSLKTLQETKAGFTDLFVIKAADLTVAVNDLLQNIALCTLNAGDVIFDRTVVEIVTAIDPQPSANAAVTVSVGRTTSGYADCLAAYTIMTGGTAVAAGGTSATGAAIGHQVIASDSTVVYAQVDINDADGALSTITTGELRIWMSISRARDRKVEA